MIPVRLSKAREWAAFVAASGKRRPYFESSRIKAEVNDHGDLAHVQIETEAIPPTEARSFGHWLLEVFGEVEEPHP